MQGELARLKLVAADGTLTNAACALLCEGEDLCPRMKLGLFKTNTKAQIADMRRERGPMIELLDLAERYVVRNIRSEVVIGKAGMRRQEIPEVPLEAIRAMASAVNSGEGPGIGEWTVRSIMREERISGRTAKRRRRYSSYEGETSKAPDNARAEGFFGRLKVEFFYGMNWGGVSVEQFMDMLDSYLRWHREKRAKSDLDYRSPMQYRRDLELLAA